MRARQKIFLATSVSLLSGIGSAHAGLPTGNINVLQTVVYNVSQLLSPSAEGSGWLGIWIYWGILIMSLFQLYKWVTLINSGSLKDPLNAFAKLVINCLIIGVLATPVDMNLPWKGGTKTTHTTVAFQVLYLIQGFGMHMTSSITDQINRLDNSGVSTETAAQTAKSIGIALKTDQTQEDKNYMATMNPAIFGVPWSDAMANPNGLNSLYPRGKLIPVKVDGQTYAAIETKSGTSAPAVSGLTNRVFDVSAANAAGLGGDIDKSGKFLTGDPQATADTLLLLGKNVSNVAIALAAQAMQNNYPPKAAGLQKMVNAAVTANDGTWDQSDFTPAQKKAAKFAVVYQACQEWVNSNPITKAAAAKLMGDASSGGVLSGMIFSPVKAITSLFYEAFCGISWLMTELIMLGSELLFWVQGPLIYLSLPFLLATTEGLRNAFWNHIKNLVILALLPCMTKILNAVLWGVIYQPLIQAFFSGSGVAALTGMVGTGASIGNIASVILTFSSIGTILAVLLMATYPFVLLVCTMKLSKSIFSGESIAGSALKTMVGAAGAGLAIASGVGMGVMAGGLAAKAAGGGMLKQAMGAMGGGAKAMAGGAAEAVGNAMGMQTAPALAAGKTMMAERKRSKSNNIPPPPSTASSLSGKENGGGGGSGGESSPAPAAPAANTQTRRSPMMETKSKANPSQAKKAGSGAVPPKIVGGGKPAPAAAAAAPSAPAASAASGPTSHELFAKAGRSSVASGAQNIMDNTQEGLDEPHPLNRQTPRRRKKSGETL